MIRSSVTTLSLLLASSFAPAIAHADTFTLTSITDPNFSTFTFTLPHMPSPTNVDTANGVFNMPITATVTGPNGTSTFADVLTVYAGTSSATSGGISDNFFFDPFGPQIFTGSLGSPTFLDQTFNLSNEGNGSTTDYVLNITPSVAVSTTPEPSALVLLGTGALSLAGVARRRLTSRK